MTTLRQEKVKLEQELLDTKKKLLDFENSLRLQKLKHKEFVEAQKRKIPKTTATVNLKSCPECKVKEKAK